MANLTSSKLVVNLTHQCITLPNNGAAMRDTILVIDDSPSMRAITKMALAHLLHPMVEAENSTKALQMLAAGQVVLILSDVNMLGLSGIDLLKQVKADANSRAIPFVLLPTEGSKDMLEQGRAYGAKARIVKSFKTDSLLATVEKNFDCMVVH